MEDHFPPHEHWGVLLVVPLPWLDWDETDRTFSLGQRQPSPRHSGTAQRPREAERGTRERVGTRGTRCGFEFNSDPQWFESG